MAYKNNRIIDHEKLNELIIRAASNRSIKGYARDAGIAYPRLFELKRKEGRNPYICTLIRLASPEANPQNGVTLMDFLYAGGYEVEAQIIKNWMEVK